MSVVKILFDDKIVFEIDTKDHAPILRQERKVTTIYRKDSNESAFTAPSAKNIVSVEFIHEPECANFYTLE